MTQSNLPKNIKSDTIIYITILLLFIMNGCNNCSSRNSLEKSTSKEIKALKTELVQLQAEQLKQTLHTIEFNSEMILIIEKESDERKINSTELKKLINEYRK